MHASADRLEFAPPATPGLLRALMLAMLAHLALLAALTSGLRWQHDIEQPAVQAELWSSMPVEAAPPPPPPPLPAPALPVPAVVTPPPALTDADIALQKEKQLKLRQQQQERAQQQEQQRQEKLRQDKLKAEKVKQDRLKQDQARREQAEQSAKDKQKADDLARQIERQRQENLNRMAGLAGATGAPGASGSAQRSAGPSAGYAGRIRARIRPNIVFTEDLSGNPTAEVEVRTAPDGTIVARRLIRPSGVAAWDEAVLKAIDKTEVLPRDTDGRVPALLEISFRPKD